MGRSFLCAIAEEDQDVSVAGTNGNAGTWFVMSGTSVAQAQSSRSASDSQV
jgi:hypothetical protein